jgi:hypothetical protein
VRLNFSYSGSRIKLESTEAIEKVVNESDPLDDEKPVSGFWFELQDAEKVLVFRRFAHSPIEDTIEIFPPNGHGPITRKSVVRPKGVFSLVVPLVSMAKFVVLHDSPHGEGRHLVGKEIARFDISAHMKSEERR